MEKLKLNGYMMNEDRFRFENDDLDFPIYDKNPYVPKWGWVVLFITIPIGLLLALSSKIPIAILSCLVILIPLLYFLKWDIKAIYQKPKLKDVGIAVLLFAGYMIYSLALMTVLEQFGIVGGDLVGESTVTVMSLFPLVFTLMTEELIKFVPFMFFLRLGYKYSGKRRLSVCLAMILVMAFFATLHAFNFNMLIFALFIQGFGSIFEFIGYIKTKNLLISYITHLCTDVFIFMTAILGL